MCEQDGHWAAALRVAFGRVLRGEGAPRLIEVRRLVDLVAQIADYGDCVVLMEVLPSNLGDVLELLSCGLSQRHSRCVAMLDASLWYQGRGNSAGDGRREQVIDVLWEAGVVEVVESPRQFAGALALYQRLASCRGARGNPLASRRSIEDWAWSRLPWQDM
ncbi:MAG TPA: hypothetical protein VHE81_02660 [Lacipirellulaceae bacterium]|nr:hypothetical protein [Lacipirellulaceae bacterium]